MAFLRFKDRTTSKTSDVSSTRAHDEADVARLVERAANGDVNSFGQLYDIYLSSIYRYVYYHVKDRMAAEDLTHEIFIKAWEAIGKYEWRGQPFSSWLFRIARNQTVDFYRAAKRDAKLKERVSATISDPEIQVGEKVTGKELIEAISCLPPQQKELIILKFIVGLDNQQIASIMEKNPGALRIMQMRALDILNQKLGENKR
ncbi:MAG: sigma-70 family RNA polymerase sigma factor [Chloroflexi bacterium]|nr:sigma-70 family RNA polymerase sigma factor [Chloroflexota bacterium]MBM4451384.1 sigma-70 family RNA polymerase sigma factor [Chloroflexota bacterium]